MGCRGMIRQGHIEGMGNVGGKDDARLCVINATGAETGTKTNSLDA